MRKLVIVGASGHGKVVADIAKNSGYEEITFLDDNREIQECGGYFVVGTSGDAVRYRGCDFIIAIGNVKAREAVFERLKYEKLHICTLIHPDAVIAEKVSIGEGTVIMAGVVVNPGTVIGTGCIINTSSSVDHDCIIGDFVHVSVGSHIAGTVSIGARTWIGAGAIVSNNVDIIGNCMIGAGAVIVKNIDLAGTYIGVPARKIR